MASAKATTATIAATALAAGAACLLFACGEQPGPGTPPPSDTGATGRAEAARFFRPGKDRIPHDLATNPGTPWGDYVGSSTCKSCHEKDHAAWRESFHSRTLYDAVPKTVFGDFSGDKLNKDRRYPFTLRAFTEGGKFWVQVEDNLEWVPLVKRKPGRDPRDTYGFDIPARRTGVFEVIYAFGNRRHQPYVVREENGRYWVPPYYWNDVVKAWMWDGWRPYTVACAPCHVTGIKSLDAPLPNDKDRPFGMTKPTKWRTAPADEGWAEGAVGCETCHGTGRRHVEKVKELGAEAYRAYVAGGGAPTIYCPGDDTPEIRMKQCDSCHNFNSESTLTWVPGPRGYDHPMAFDRLRPTGNPGWDQWQFYADGTDMSPCTVGSVFRGSAMGKSGVECKDCHDSHGNSTFGSLVKPLDGNALCLSCHVHAERFGTKELLERHTHHAAASPGSSCAECHMPRDKHFTNGAQVMSQQIHSHAMSVPTGDVTDAAPRPSCNTCHTDRDAMWTRKTLEGWFPPKK